MWGGGGGGGGRRGALGSGRGGMEESQVGAIKGKTTGEEGEEGIGSR